jgi:hypothetical protein
VPDRGHSAKTALPSVNLQALGKEDSLPSVNQLTLGKAFFTECLFWALGKAYFYFFYFGKQTFCDMLLYYVDLHVPFWDNYNNVFYS